MNSGNQSRRALPFTAADIEASAAAATSGFAAALRQLVDQAVADPSTAEAGITRLASAN